MKNCSKNKFSRISSTTENASGALTNTKNLKKNFLLLKLLLLVNFGIIIAFQSFGQLRQIETTPQEVVEININTRQKFQTIEHFGASDAWAAQFVGLWPDQKKKAVAELLFSNENDATGNPKGIGLSMWRFNVGAGSAEQGEESGIRDEWRRAESFLSADGSYDWDKQAGQVWFAKAAQELGVEHLLIFPNSPPVSMTKTGKAYAKDGKSNLAEEKYEAFGEYLARVIKGLGEKGLKVDYVSPVNEPQWDWSDSGQEGTPFWNNEIAGIAKAVDQALNKNKLTTKIDIAEAGKINYLYEQADKDGRGEQITDFFISSSANYIGDLKHLSRTISAHSYFTTSPFESGLKQREDLATALKEVEGLSYWMSEYCILGDNGGEINGNGRDLGIDPALYLAKVIHNDLTVANASAWHWWLAISPYNYKDGLVYIDKNKEDGDYHESKMLWALGNYSRFIRPGYQRLEVEIDRQKQQSPEFLVSAYGSADQQEIVMVFINSGNKGIKVNLTQDGALHSIKSTYITSKNSDLENREVKLGELLIIPDRSIVTIVVKMQDA